MVLTCASRTIQIALNDDLEYDGRRLCFFTPQILRRSAGDLTIHGRDVLHAVTILEKGTRYGLFVVDELNGLGETLVVWHICATMNYFLLKFFIAMRYHLKT